MTTEQKTKALLSENESIFNSMLGFYKQYKFVTNIHCDDAMIARCNANDANKLAINSTRQAKANALKTEAIANQIDFFLNSLNQKDQKCLPSQSSLPQS